MLTRSKTDYKSWGEAISFKITAWQDLNAGFRLSRLNKGQSSFHCYGSSIISQGLWEYLTYQNKYILESWKS